MDINAASVREKTRPSWILWVLLVLPRQRIRTTNNKPEEIVDFILVLVDNNPSRRNAKKILLTIFSLQFSTYYHSDWLQFQVKHFLKSSTVK